MNAPTKTVAIPAAYAELAAWPRLDELVLQPEHRDAYVKRCAAVEMYARGSSVADITEQTGKSKSEVYRLIKRCVTVAPDGQIYGFRALAPSVAVIAYKHRVDDVDLVGSGSSRGDA